ncbi:GNAT family N-acetyltransferase [Halobacteriales archaeon Cl-PHB]
MTDYTIRRIPGDGTLEDAFDVRRDVFVQEQGVAEAIEMDGKDEDARHVVVYDGDYPVATARTRFVSDDTAKFERVAVRADYRGEDLGRLVMEAIEDVARQAGATDAVLHGQTSVEGFYHELDYETTSDEVFYEADIPHVQMEKPL